MAKQRPKAHKAPAEQLGDLAQELATLRESGQSDITITAGAFAHSRGLTPQEAEERLRRLTQLGWLFMAAKRDEDNKFLMYTWMLK